MKRRSKGRSAGLALAVWLIWLPVGSSLNLIPISNRVGNRCKACPYWLKDNSHHPQSIGVEMKKPELEDADGDGISDDLEQKLAEEFAPIVYHNRHEKSFPSNVEDFFSLTSLLFFDEDCSPDSNSSLKQRCSESLSDISGMNCLIQERPSFDPAHIYDWQRFDPCRQKTYFAYTLLDRKKKTTFYLADVEQASRKGVSDTTRWVTYYHAYTNDQCAGERCGITIQYWRFYLYNYGNFFGTRLGNHGGDWEAVHVVLNERYDPVEVRFLGHTKISSAKREKAQEGQPGQKWKTLRWEGTHPKIKSENGGHASNGFDEQDESRYIRQETWTGGRVHWPARQRFNPGKFTPNAGFPLQNLGEKTRPMEGMLFIQYSGLWGSPGKSLPLAGAINSGYWGPAYNETGRRKDEFVTAWCAGMKDSDKEVLQKDGTKILECFPTTIP